MNGGKMRNHPQMSELADEHGMDLHYGREDSHVHEWSWKPWFEVRKFVCVAKDCNAILTMAEAERRINATEKLSAESALACWHKIEALSRELMGYESDLEAYAAALKEKTPTP
jgi:hypothetical protein